MQLDLRWPDGLPDHYSLEFHQGMFDRMAMSYFKYGLSAESIAKTDPLATALSKIADYQRDGNTEWLMDAANYLMIEFMFPSHPDAHFRVTDGDESKGYMLKDGTFTTVHKRDLG